MDSIVIKVSDLYSLAKQLKDDKMEYVHLSLLEEDFVDNERIPPSIEVSATESKDSVCAVDYDGIEAVEDVSF